MTKVVASSPTRIDLAGGTLDLWPVHHLLDFKTTVNVAITLNAEVTIENSKDNKFHFESRDLELSESGSFAELVNSSKLPLFALMLKAYWDEGLPAITISSIAKSPAGAGLGGSSCLAVTMGAALWKKKLGQNGSELFDERLLVQTAQDVEARLIASPTGCQDYWGAVRGGVNVIEFPFGGTQVTTFDTSGVGAELNERLIVCYSGKSRDSAINNWEIYKRIFDGDKNLLARFNEIGSLAVKCGEALKLGHVERALTHSMEEWELRKKLWPNIETVETKEIDEVAKKAGAQFSRVCGAGGGGVMAIIVSKENRQKVCDALESTCGTVLDATIADQGLKFY